MLNKERPEVIDTLYDILLDAIYNGHHYSDWLKEQTGFELHYCEAEELDKKIADWLNSEYVEPFKITKAEKCILESLKYDWLAKDKSGCLYLYCIKPAKGRRLYFPENNERMFQLSVFNENIFPFITFEGGPVNRHDILANCEVIDDVK